MIRSEDKITTSQAIVVLVSYIMAAGILTLPRTAVEEAGTPDVWISVLLGGLVTTAAGVVMTKLSQHYPGQTFFQYGGDIVGKWLSIVISLLFIEHFVAIAAFEARILAEVITFFAAANADLGDRHVDDVDRILFNKRRNGVACPFV